MIIIKNNVFSSIEFVFIGPLIFLLIIGYKGLIPFFVKPSEKKNKK
jgi:hypothetical protein